MPEISASDAKVMVEAAISKKIESSLSQNQAELHVAISLLRYMIHGELSVLTSAGGIRDAFRAAPDMDVLVFIGQLNLDSNEVFKHMVNLITREFQQKKCLPLSEAQHELFEMLTRYQRDGRIEMITRTAKLRELISRKIINLEKLQETFSHLLQEHADETDKKMNEIIDMVKNNQIVLLKHHFEKFINNLSMAKESKERIGPIDLYSRHNHNEIEFLQQMLSANDFDEMQKIAIDARKGLLRNSTNFKVSRMLNAFEFNETALSALIELNADIPSSYCDSERKTFAQSIYNLSDEISTYANVGVSVPGYQFTYLSAILSASDIQQVKEFTTIVKKLPELRRFDFGIRHIMKQIEESDTFEELNAKMPSRLLSSHLFNVNV